MKVPYITIKNFETYYYANIIDNILDDPQPYLVSLHPWHEERRAQLFLPPFNKWSVLHDFSAFIIEGLIDETISSDTADKYSSGANPNLWIDNALRHHCIFAQSFANWLTDQEIPAGEVTEDDISEYHFWLRLGGELDKLVEQLSDEVFFLLFSNRNLLQKLNHYVANIVGEIIRDEVDGDLFNLLKTDGVPKRQTIPEWVKRAVFYRDRGRCTSCFSDLSGLLAVGFGKHFDHVIPLAHGGINDVTNIQLLCETCNLTKSNKLETTSNKYEAWYFRKEN